MIKWIMYISKQILKHTSESHPSSTESTNWKIRPWKISKWLLNGPHKIYPITHFPSTVENLLSRGSHIGDEWYEKGEKERENCSKKQNRCTDSLRPHINTEQKDYRNVSSSSHLLAYFFKAHFINPLSRYLLKSILKTKTLSHKNTKQKRGTLFGAG